MILFRQLFDASSSTYTYLLADAETRFAILIDPVFEQVRRDSALLHELGLRLEWTLETHVHADHVTGAWILRRRLGSKIALSSACGARGADRYLEDGETISFGPRHVEARATPGHTKGCMSFVLDDATLALTGDTLLIRGCGRTDFQGGDPRAMFDSVRRRLFSLPENCLLYPGHDYRGLTVTSVREEQQFNPRLGGEVALEDFSGYMNHLGLPHPKLMEIAVPANLVCGRPNVPDAALRDPDWAPLTMTFAGIWEVQPHWLEENLHTVQIIDVRDTEEFSGPLGHIPGALLVPLDKLAEHTAEFSTDRPIVTVCRSGVRSAQASVLLAKQGFSRVANLAGGMLRWRASRFLVEGGAE